MLLLMLNKVVNLTNSWFSIHENYQTQWMVCNTQQQDFEKNVNFLRRQKLKLVCQAFFMSNLCGTAFGNRFWAETKFLKLAPWTFVELWHSSWICRKSKREWHFLCQLLEVQKLFYCGSKLVERVEILCFQILL